MSTPKSSANETDQLSARELEILGMVAKGRTNDEIASGLHISEGTVRTHLTHIYEKLHVRSRTQAAAKYYQSAPKNPLGQTGVN
jgi:DNA-binding CsgD family transcriptional regulator